MLDTEPTGADSGASTDTSTTDSRSASGAGGGDATETPRRRRRAASRPAGPPAPLDEAAPPAADDSTGSTKSAAPAKKTTRKRAAKKAASAAADAAATEQAVSEQTGTSPAEEPAQAPKARRTRKRAAAAGSAASAEAAPDSEPASEKTEPSAAAAPGVLFQAPEPVAAPARRARKSAATTEEPESAEPADSGEETGDEAGEGGARRRRRGGRGRRGRGKAGEGSEGAENGDTGSAAETAEADAPDESEGGAAADDEDEGGEGSSRRRRRRRRRRGGEDDATAPDDPPNTVTRVRSTRKTSRADDDGDGVRSVKGSTRLEAKKQRRREGREAGRRRPSIITEAEFLARRESVRRSMIVRQTGERTQIAVLEDDVLVEHYVASASSGGMVGNVYLGKVQNVLPSMEAAFVDVGKGRNAVLYAGEVNWDAAGLEGQPKRIEQALKSGDSVLVQVTKDPIGHKGARLTSQVSLAGRYLVLVPNGSMTGISRKLPDTERSRLKAILKKVVPEGAGVIVRTAAEGASEEELSRDVARLTAQWEVIEKNAAKGGAPTLLYGEPDLSIRVVRDIFNEDFGSLVVSGDDAWDMLKPYVDHVAPDLADRVTRWTDEQDVFTAHRVDEQLAKALDRKVWLPSGGYLIIDRTEAMVVVDVNTGKFTGAGGNLEETVTKNNLEAAEEIVRQLRLRDLGGIIVIDFIDMVLESNRELVLRRLTECLGRDRTKHQVAEVTSLGLVQMTRKRVGQGLHEAFAEPCEHCNGRGYHIHTEPIETKSSGGGRSRGGAKAATPAKRSGKKSAAKVEKAEKADDKAAAAVEADASPVAVEDPVEGSGGAVSTGGTASDAEADADVVEPAAATPRRRGRRRATG